MACQDKELSMGYTAIGLILLGLAVGAMSRLRILVWIVVLLVPASILFARLMALTLLDTILALFLAQAILQTSFVSGLFARRTVCALLRVRTATQQTHGFGRR